MPQFLCGDTGAGAVSLTQQVLRCSSREPPCRAQPVFLGHYRKDSVCDQRQAKWSPGHPCHHLWPRAWSLCTHAAPTCTGKPGRSKCGYRWPGLRLLPAPHVSPMAWEVLILRPREFNSWEAKLQAGIELSLISSPLLLPLSQHPTLPPGSTGFPGTP